MSTASYGLQTFISDADVQDWLSVTQRKCVALAVRAAEAGNRRQLYVAFREMAILLHEACQEVWVMSGS
jgi:hypothetical protein